MIKVRKIKGLCQRVEKKIRVCGECSVHFILISGIYTSTSSLQSRKGGCCSSDFTGIILVGIQGAPCPSLFRCSSDFTGIILVGIQGAPCPSLSSCSSDFTGIILVGIQGAPCPSLSCCFFSLRF